MSLEDELTEEKRKVTPSNVSQWMDTWRDSLSTQDKKAWDAAVSNPTMSGAVLYRVICRHGFPRKITAFKGWLKDYRDNL